MRSILSAVLGTAVLAIGSVALAAQPEEAALAERFAALADRFGNTGNAAQYKQALYDAASRLSERDVRFLRSRFRAAEMAGDVEGMLSALQEWRKLEPNNVFVQIKLIDVYMMRLQTADARLNYARQVVDAESVNAEVRSHAGLQMARLLLEQSRTQQAMESLRRALLLNGLNVDVINLQWQLAAHSSTPLQRVNLLLSMLKANPSSVDAVLSLAEELAGLNMVQTSLQWYGQAANMTRPTGGLSNSVAKDYAAMLLIAGQDRGAAEIGTRLLERDATDPGAWFVTLLAEKQMKDRFNQVKNNALIGMLNRLAVIRQKMGFQEATTQPLGSEQIRVPSLAGDVEAVKKATPELRRAYVGAVSDVAWLLVFHDDRPAEAAPLIKLLGEVDPEQKDLINRLQGWSLLKANKIEEARALLLPLVDRDPLAALGLVRVYRAEASEAQAATDLARKLCKYFPSGLLGAYVRSEVAGFVGEIPPEPMAEAVRDALDRFPRDLLKLSTAPHEFVTMRLQPQQVGHDYAEPILVDVELRNLQEIPVVLGSSGMVHDTWLDVQMRGLIQQWISGVSWDQCDGPVILQPGAAIRYTTRLDRGPLADALERSVQQSVQLSVFGLTNAVPTEMGVVPGPCGIRGRMTQMLERRAASLASESAIRRARSTIDSSDAVAKIKLIDQVVAHLRIAADPEGSPQVKAMDAELRDMLTRLGQDSSPAVRGWSRYQMARMLVEPAEKSAADLGKESAWYVRMLSVMCSMETSESARNAILKQLSSDQDAAVRGLAAGIPAAMEKVEEKPIQAK